MKQTVSVSGRMRIGVLLMGLLLSVTACGASEETPPDTEKAAETQTEQAAETEAPALRDALPEKDYGGAGYKVLAAAEQWQDKYLAEEETGEAMNDAVYALNREIEERFNVDIQYEIVNGYTAGQSTVSKLLFETVSAGDCVYDLFAACAAYVGPRIMEGVLWNLDDAEYLDFSAPWWYQNVNGNIKIKDALYVGAGAFGIHTIEDCWGVMFHKEIVAALDMPSFYEDVRAGKWTFDRMLDYAKQADADLDGNGSVNEKDRFGLLGTSDEPFCCLPYAMGRKITEAGADGLPVLTGVNERIVGIFDKCKALIDDKNTYYSCAVDPVEQMIPMFQAGQALFMIYPISVVENESMRNGADFGILPLPKYDETQKEHYTSCFPDIQAIPLVVKDNEMSQIVLEALNSTAYRITVPALYDVVLQRKMTRDEESADMLDLITRGTTTDFGLVFFSTIKTELYSTGLILRGKQDYATWWAKNETSSQKNLQKIIDTITEFSENQ